MTDRAQNGTERKRKEEKVVRERGGGGMRIGTDEEGKPRDRETKKEKKEYSV